MLILVVLLLIFNLDVLIVWGLFIVFHVCMSLGVWSLGSIEDMLARCIGSIRCIEQFSFFFFAHVRLKGTSCVIVTNNLGSSVPPPSCRLVHSALTGTNTTFCSSVLASNTISRAKDLTMPQAKEYGPHIDCIMFRPNLKLTLIAPLN